MSENAEVTVRIKIDNKISLPDPGALMPNVMLNIMDLITERARENAHAKSKGGKFWPSIADSVRGVSQGGNTIVINTDHAVAAHKQFGGTIRPTRGKNLAIPISDEAAGVWPREWGGSELFVVKGDFNAVLGYDAGDEFVGLWVLAPSVTQAPEPWWPTSGECAEIAETEINAMLAKQGA